MPGGQIASGRFVELVPEQRLVFTWGWEGEAPPVPPGSTTVVIELEPDPSGTLTSPDTQRRSLRRPWPSTTEMAGSATSTDCASEPKAATPAPTRRKWKQAAAHHAKSRTEN